MPCSNLVLRRPDELPIKHNLIDKSQVNSLDQLRREPHILGWMSRLRSQAPPLATAS
jgi:hypothetical protein